MSWEAREGPWRCSSSPSWPQRRGKRVSKETKVDILVTPLVTICVGVGLSAWWAPAIGAAASAVGGIIEWATVLQPFWMGILVSVVVGDRPHPADLLGGDLCRPGPHRPGRRGGGGRLLRQYGGLRRPLLPGEPVGRPGEPGPWHLHAPDAQHRPRSPDLAARHPHLRSHRAPGHLRVPPGDERPPPGAWPRAWAPAAWWARSGCTAGWVADVASGAKAAITPFDWAGLLLISFLLPGALCWLFGLFFRRIGWIREGGPEAGVTGCPSKRKNAPAP